MLNFRAQDSKGPLAPRGDITERGHLVPPNKRRVGVIAQDVAKVLPAEFKNVVYTLTSDEDEEETMAVDYSRLSVLLLGACQALCKRVEALEAKQTKKKVNIT